MDFMLLTDRLSLRTLGPANAAHVADYLRRNREHFRNAGPLVTEDYFTESYQRARLQREVELMGEGTFFRLWMFLRDASPSMGPIGDISLSQIFRGIMLSCYIGYKIDKGHTGRGYMTEAVGRVVQFAFDDLCLHRLEANIMPSNTASQRVVERLGFVKEGFSRRYLRINGVWEDHLRYARVREDD